MGPEPDDTPDEPAPELHGPALRRVFDHLVFDAVRRLDTPHLVIIRSGYSTQFCGPFPDALAAACAAEVELAGNASLPREERVEVTVAPLIAPICPHTAGAGI